MKKILFATLALIVLSVTVSAQGGLRRGVCRNGDQRITRVERMQLRKDVVRQGVARRMATRDGIVTPMERRKLNALKRDTRRDVFRYRHNGRNRII